jgi:hypothetical protein
MRELHGRSRPDDLAATKHHDLRLELLDLIDQVRGQEDTGPGGGPRTNGR